jgi:hypothetical protein
MLTLIFVIYYTRLVSYQNTMKKHIIVVFFVCISISLFAYLVNADSPDVVISSPTDGSTVASSTVTFMASSTQANLASLIPNLDDSLVSWWQMEDNVGNTTVVDYMGNYNGTAQQNTSALTTTGQNGNAFSYNGSNDFITMPSYDFGDTFTIAAWIKPTETSQILTIASNSNSGAGTHGFRFYVNYWNTNNRVVYLESAGPSGSGWTNTSGSAVSFGVWSFVTLTANKTSGIAHIYVNGVDETDATNKTVSADFTSSASWKIGKMNDGYPYNGSIDDVMVFNRILTDNEIVALYDGTSINHTSTLEEGSHTYTVYSQDSSANVVSSTSSFTINTSTVALTYATSTTGGSITGSSTQILAYGDDGTEVTAVPDTGYDFVSWSDDSTSTSRTDTNITTNTAYTASFAINTFTLTYSAGTDGTISGSSSQTVNYGSDGSAVTAVANDGYTFSQWSDGSTTNPRIDTNITAEASISATFTANSSVGGTFIPPPTPLIISPPTISYSNGSVTYSTKNAHQIAISETPDFAGTSWVPYTESYKFSDKTLYIKFRSKEGGVTEVFTVKPDTTPPLSTSYEGKLIKYNNSPKVYLIKNNNKHWIKDEKTFNESGYQWDDINIIESKIKYSDGESLANNNYYNFTKNLEFGVSEEDVRKLQKYLNNNNFEVAPKNYPGAPGHETTMFGYATQNALIKFQQAHDLPAYGYFGPMTRNLISR